MTASRFEPSPPAAISTLLARQAVEFEVPLRRRGGRQRRGPALRARLVCRGRRRAAYAPEVVVGADAATTAAAIGADVVLNGITGAIGLRPTLAAWRPARPWPWRTRSPHHRWRPRRAAARPDQIVPVDSEHSAIAQCLRGGRRGGRCGDWSSPPVGTLPRLVSRAIARVTPEQALAHPNYAMGKVITTNSATLVNKGLEVIEAHLLFDVPFSAIDVVVHPQQWIHSMVEFRDGSTIAQMGPPRMLVPIALGLSWPDRLDDIDEPCDWSRAPGSSIRSTTTPSRRPAGAAGGEGGGTTAPAVYNAANEVCVEAFHGGRISFLDIVDTVARVVEAHDGSDHDSSSVEGVLRRHLGAGACHGDRGEGGTDELVGLRGGVLIAALGVALSIALHEVGHLVPAKRFGVRVTQYMVGFGPTVCRDGAGKPSTDQGHPARWLHSDDRDVPAQAGDAPGTIRATSTGRFSQLADEAAPRPTRNCPGDENRVFYRLSTPKKVAVMLGGPLMNLLIAVSLLTGMVTIHGTAETGQGPGGLRRPVRRPGDRGRDGDDLRRASGHARCGRAEADGQGHLHRRQPGHLERRCQQADPSASGPADGHRRRTPGRAGEPHGHPGIANQVATYDAQGNPVLDGNGQPVTQTAGFIGISSATPIVMSRSRSPPSPESGGGPVADRRCRHPDPAEDGRRRAGRLQR